MRYLLISEKPSLMRLVQAAFKEAHLGFEVDFMSLHGHCCTLYSPGDYKPEWEKWDEKQLPMIPERFKHKPVDEKLVKEIKKQLESKKYDGFINCTDAEREGQNIFYSLYDYLESDLPVKRFWASDLTDEKLVTAWRNLKDDQNDYYLKRLTSAALLRANADWLVGMNFSRMVSLINNKNIPVGRVMTVLLAILAKREEEIKNFKPTTTYKVLVDYKEGFSGELKHDPFLKKEEADEVVSQIGKTAIVKEFSSKIKVNEAPLLYSLGDLQNDANKAFGYSLADSLAIIQGLYEKKILSYPRTDCPYLTSGEGARMTNIVSACRCIPEMLEYTIDNKKMHDYTKTKYVNDSKVQAHYAIVFTGKEFVYNGLTKNEQNIVTLVAKRIFATLMDPAKFTEISLIATQKDKTFVTKESVLTYPGYKVLYGEKAKTITIKDIRNGQQLVITKAYTKDVVSTCPARFNDASLNKAMINVGSLIEDKNLASALEGKTKDQGGIGTPATRAGIVEKLLDPKKDWVSRKGKSFYVSDKGLSVYRLLKDYEFASPILTAEWEQKLKNIEEGKFSPKEFNEQLTEYINKECEELKKAHLNNDLKCPICGASIKESDKYFYCSKYKDPCSFIVGKITAQAKISEKDLLDIIKNGKTESKSFKSKDGKKFNASLGIVEGNVRFIFDNDSNNTNIICKCGKPVKYLNGKYGKYYKCDCGKILNESVFEHKLTKTEVKKLFDDQVVRIEKLKSKNGKVFTANLKIEDNKVKIDSFD